MEDAPYRVVTESPRGGSANGGHFVSFVMRFDGGAEELFYCDAAAFSKLLGNLRTYGQMAEKTLLGAPASEVAVASPYIVAEVQNSAISTDRSLVAVQFGTTEGIPLTIAMSPEHAEKTIAMIQRELGNLSRSADPERRH